LRGSKSIDLIQQELNELEKERNLKKASWKDMLSKTYLFRPLIVIIILHMTQLLSGVTVVTYYSSKILIDFNVDKDIADYASILFSFVRLLLCFLMIFFYKTFENTGRKKLMLISIIGMCISSFIIAITFLFKVNKFYKYYIDIFYIKPFFFIDTSMG